MNDHMATFEKNVQTSNDTFKIPSNNVTPIIRNVSTVPDFIRCCNLLLTFLKKIKLVHKLEEILFTK